MPDELKAARWPLRGPLCVKLANGWLQFEDDETGRFYFHQRTTGRTVWVMPQEARPPTTAASDAAVFEAGMRDEPEDEGEEEEDDDDVDEPDELDEEAMLEASPSMAAGASPTLDGGSSTDEAAEAAAKAQKRAARTPQDIGGDPPIGAQVRAVAAVADEGLPGAAAHGRRDARRQGADLHPRRPRRRLPQHRHDRQGQRALPRGARGGAQAARGAAGRSVQYGEIIKRAARQFKGCYTRYVTHYDAAEAHLQKLKENDKDKHRYLEVCKTHPDAGGLDVRSFLIQPVQRVPRYRMLLEDLLKHTDADHADEAPLRESLSRVCEVAMHINEEKRHLDGIEQMRQLIGRFANGAVLEKELVSYERRLLREGALAKVRMSKTQQRLVYLCNDVLLYATRGKGERRRGARAQGEDLAAPRARVVLHPSTESAPHAFAVVAKGGKGYTWLAESEAEQQRVVRCDPRRDRGLPRGRGAPRRSAARSRMATQILSLVEREAARGARRGDQHRQRASPSTTCATARRASGG